MLRKCTFASKHFELNDPACPFLSVEDDPITKTKVGQGRVHVLLHAASGNLCWFAQHEHARGWQQPDLRHPLLNLTCQEVCMRPL
jgi:hypothetical protein